MGSKMPRERPDIIISSLDSWRIYRLLDEMPADAFAGRDALMYEISRGRIVGPREIPPHVVTMNSVLRVTLLAPKRRTLELTLVYPEDADEEAGRISIFTALGSALIGLSEGAEIDWPRPEGGMMTLRVEEILFQPERAGQFQI